MRRNKDYEIEKAPFVSDTASIQTDIAYDANSVLKYITANNMINLADVQKQILMKDKEKILSQHKYSIWHNEKENVWYTYLPDETKKSKRKKVKKKLKEDLDECIYNFYKSSSLCSTTPIDLFSSRTLEDLFYEFMECKKLQVKSKTVKRMMADWNRFYSPRKSFIHKPYVKITKVDVDTFFNQILTEHQLTRKAFNNMCGILKQTCNYIVDCEYTTKNPYRVNINRKLLVTEKKVSAKEVYQSSEKELLISEMERRFSNNPSNTAPLGIMLDFELGLRKGELLALSESDISMENGMFWLHIHRQVIEDFDTTDIHSIRSKGFYVVEYTKSEKGDRMIPLTPRALEIIQRVKNANMEFGHQYKDFLFVRDNYILTEDAIDAQIRRGCEYIGLPVKTMHDIRRTYASTLHFNGVPAKTISELLGHADLATTYKHYLYSIDNNASSHSKVLHALSTTPSIAPIPIPKKVTTSDQNIIHFPTIKKAESL